AELADEGFVVAIDGAPSNMARINQSIDQLLEREPSLMNPPQIGRQAIEAVPRRLLQQDLRKPDDCTHWRAEVLADMGEKGALKTPIRLRFGRCRHVCFHILPPAQSATGFRCFDRARLTFFRGGEE